MVPITLSGFGGGEDELHVRRRLLHHLQQRVEALLGDHVGLVDDVDLEARLHRCEEDALAQLAGVVDAAMGGGVDLDHVDAAGPPVASSRQLVQWPQGVGVGPFSQLRQRARMRAQVVFPQPRGPLNR